MGAIIAVLHKKGKDATETALAMLKTLKSKNTEAYGIASPNTIKIERSLARLQNQKLDSPIAVGYLFSRILKRDKPQPLKLEDAAAVFDGRTFSLNDRRRDAEAFALDIAGNRVESVKTFIKETEGDFAFALAEPGRLIAGRDTLGVRPLYYGENAIFAALASERKPLWKIGIEHADSFRPGHVALVSEQGFKFRLAKRLTYAKPKQVTMKAASDRLQTLLEQAVRQRVAGLREVAVAFSGGLDSSIVAFLAKKTGVNVQLLHVSLKNQTETEHAKAMADKLKLPIHSHTYTQDDVSESLPTVLYLIEEPNPIKTSIGIPFYWVAEKAAEMHFKIMLAGQGGDELFAGYRRYVDDYIRGGSGKAQVTIFKDIVGMYKSNFERDFKICNFHGVELRLPLASYRIAKSAIALPIGLKMQPSGSTLRKLVLRQVARNIGLPQAIVDRPKKAIQYATGVSETLKKIARQRHLPLNQYLQETFQAALKRMMPCD